MGRPSLIITETQKDQVSAWIRDRVPLERMAARLGMAPKTFRKHFAVQLGLADVPDAAPLLPDEILPAQQAKFDAYRPTGEIREMVLVLVGADITRTEIARKVGISIEMLEYHFAEELNSGIAIAQGNVIMQIYQSAKGGNMSAAKTYLMLGNRRSEVERDMERDPLPARPAEGKKVTQQAESTTAANGTPFDRLLH